MLHSYDISRSLYQYDTKLINLNKALLVNLKILQSFYYSFLINPMKKGFSRILIYDQKEIKL